MHGGGAGTLLVRLRIIAAMCRGRTFFTGPITEKEFFAAGRETHARPLTSARHSTGKTKAAATISALVAALWILSVEDGVVLRRFAERPDRPGLEAGNEGNIFHLLPTIIGTRGGSERSALSGVVELVKPCSGHTL
ncbi:MAG: hypothetical protein FP825_11855 [Hyphomonas sp.]|uniref:hypothetical protein n=1 Tax=Hyphomonas sp. TaxID=87 RepID=UPI00181C643C|nr:hypothetical protein [Hyphomonas sp.]MBA3069161.1 hypothetical protein [Hyphomonas sp.]MBU4062346.1 hypothetical protein [Alphaproteobacteria bacterium]MBU4162728.1 hypothetical protein [Alphaproteobacteria bacterium]